MAVKQLILTRIPCSQIDQHDSAIASLVPSPSMPVSARIENNRRAQKHSGLTLASFPGPRFIRLHEAPLFLHVGEKSGGLGDEARLTQNQVLEIA